MRTKIIFFLALAGLLANCKSKNSETKNETTSHPNTFVLEDIGEDKFYLSDSVKKLFKKGYIDKSPLIAIDGVEFEYQTSLDTIIIPLKKKEITVIDFINKGSSHVIYGENANKGAVVINTIALRQNRLDAGKSKN